MHDTSKHSVSMSNPFLEQLEEHLSTDDLAPRLAYSPLAEVDRDSLTLKERKDLLAAIKFQLFEPTLSSLSIVGSLFRLIHDGYQSRNPCIAQVRNKTMAVASAAKQTMSAMPWFGETAMGMRISGETGTGKSHEIKRGLSILPPVITHGKRTDAGWMHMTQVVWLYVAMSHDGSLGGLLLNILCALDETAGTNYAADKSLTKLSNEKLSVRIAIILRNHGVGVLVIDELQKRNFSGGAHGGLAATFFLRLLNIGIPIVLMGNPFGLEGLDTFSQDMRRIGAGGSFDMRPLAQDDYDWTDCLVPAIWGYDVMPEQTQIEDSKGEILFQYSGGIRGYAVRIRAESQRIALELGARTVTTEHMEQAYQEIPEKDRLLIQGFRDRDPRLLQQFEDVRWEFYAKAWGYFDNQGTGQRESFDQTGAEEPNRQKNEKSEAVEPGEQTKQQKPPAHVRDLQTIKAKRTRNKNASKQQAQTRETLAPEDMRNRGLQDYLIAGLENLRKAS